MNLKRRLGSFFLTIFATLMAAPLAANGGTYTAGDLVLFFFQENGSQTIYVNLGPAYTYRGNAAGPQDAPKNLNILDIKSALDQAYGTDWATKDNVYAGLAAVRSNSTSTAAAAVNGDPGRTIYTSVANDLVSDPGNRSGLGNTDMTSIANGIISMNTRFPANVDYAVVPSADSFIPGQNPFLAPGILDTAFNSLAGGVAQKGTAGSLGSFGNVSNVEFALDLHRILATNGGSGTITGGLDSAGNPVPIRTSTYEGTITINSSGVVGFSAVPPAAITISGNLASLSSTAGNASSTTSFTVSGANMKQAITINAPNGFEVSTSPTSGFSGSITVGAAGTIESTTIYVRLSASAELGTYSGDITLISGSAARTIATATSTVTATAANPVISVSGGLTVLSTTYGTASSTSNFTISGTNMTAPVTVTAPAGFQVSTSSTSGFAPSISVPASGTLSNTTIHVRLSPTADAGTYSGNISLTSTGATEKTIATASSTISKAAQTIDAIASISNKAFGDAAFAVTAPSSSSSLPVTLSVKSGPATISDNTVTLTGAGTVVLAANQSGNANYNAAAEVTTSFSVSKAAQTIGAFTSIGNKTFGDAPFAVTAPTASSGLAITLSVKSGPATISGNIVTITGAGTVVLAANQAGNADYAAATEVTTSFSVAKVAQTIGAFISISNKTFGDAPFAVIAPSSSSSLPVTLSVKSGPATISGNTVTLTGAGTVTLAANQAGSDNYAAAPEVTTTFSVAKATPTLTSSPTASSIKKGQNLSQSNLAGGSASAAGVSVFGNFAFANPSTAPEAGTANHSVIFTPTEIANYNTFTLDVSVTVNESSLPALTSPSTSSGVCFQPFQYQITATNNPTGFAANNLPEGLSINTGTGLISGTPTKAGAYDVALSITNTAGDFGSSLKITVNKAAQTIAPFTSIGNKAFGDAPFAITAPTASSSLPITLSVKSGPATISGNTVTLTGVGTVTLAANQAGNDNYTLAQEVTTSFPVSKGTKGTQTIGTFTSIGNKTFGDAPFAITAPAASSGLAVSFSVKSGPATISGNTVTLTGAGIVEIAANQAGNDNYNPATEVTTSFTVSKGPQTIGPFSSIGTKAFGEAPFAVSAPSSTSSLPVTLSVKSGPATISGNTVTLTGAGTVEIAANQEGNANYNAATEVITSFSVSKGTSTVTLGSLSPTYDGTAKSATATTSPTITGNVTYTYTGISPTVYAQSTTPPTQAGSYTVVGTINDANYSGNATGTLVITKATPSITTKPNASNITLGQKLSDSTLSGGIGSVNGTFAFTNPNTQPSTAGTSSQSVTFTPADTNNYLTTTTSIDIVTQAGSSPVITTQPIDLTISQGNSATFSVQATGQNLSYQWKRNGLDINNARNSSYTVSSTSIATAGEYSVVVSSDNGSQPITSRAAKLIVTFPLADLSINENTSPVLSVSVTGTGLKYQWFKDGTPLRGQTNSTLTLKDITVDQAGTYSVEVTDANGNKFTSQSSKVSVNAVLPVITTQPSNVSVYTGGSATMRVLVKGAGHAYQWRKNGINIPGETRNTLTLTDIILADAGEYSVSITNSVGSVTSRSARLRVLASNSNNQGGATARPTITSHPISQTVADGSRVMMSVNASGGGLLYQWTRNRQNITGANQSSYTIPAASSSDSGDYAVIVYNSLGTVTSNIARIAISAPEIDVQQPAGSSLVSSTSKISFGTAKTTSNGIVRTFTIRNTGTTKLTGISFSKSGSHQSDFTVTQSNLREVAPGASATFTVTFKPAAIGARTASIRIASNDRDENPFIINLAGEGAR
ncbi:MAG: immunoglobulin domain-containing protein [Verrucomicrobia bacterium]|nr:immunoglobulin domain-containing protein [Verrucomicrobiota bacterium]